jgi:integral membrane protein
MAVKVVGWAHGALFVAYLFTLLEAALDRRWSLPRTALAFGASLVPFATFVLDARLRREEQAGAPAVR